MSASAAASADCSFKRGNFGFGDFEQIQIALGNLENQQVAEMVQQIAQQPAQVFAAARQFVQLRERGGNFAGENGVAQFENLALRREAEHRKHVGLLDFVAAKTDELVERGFGVAHAAVGAARDGVQRGGVNLDFFLPGNFREMLGDERGSESGADQTAGSARESSAELFPGRSSRT